MRGVRHRCLVTGAAGFIGSHLSEALIQGGHEVTGVDNFDPFYARDVKERNLSGLRKLPGFRFVEADVARDAVPLDGVEAIIHLAAKPGVRPSLEDPGAYMEANVTATARLIDAARRVGLTRIVFGSSSSVYGNATPAPFAEAEPAVLPISPYAASKRAVQMSALGFAYDEALRSARSERALELRYISHPTTQTKDDFASALGPTRYDPATLVVVAAPREIGREWRLVVVGAG